MYTYNNLDRLDSPNGRKYRTPSGVLPSVTTILDATKSDAKKEILNQWRERIGVEKANKITKISATIGTLFHENMENYLLQRPRCSKSGMHYKIANKMADVVIEKGMCNVTKVFGVEAMLYFPGLYAGTADFIGDVYGQLSIGDFKNTRRPKTEEMVEDYYYQLVAYGMAHNELFQTNIKQGVIWMCAREPECLGEYQEFVLCGDKWNEYETKWINRIQQYYDALK